MSSKRRLMTREHQWKILQGLSSQQKIQFPDFRKINRDERFKEIDEKLSLIHI